MMMNQLVNTDLINLNLQATTKDELFAELAQMLFDNHRITSVSGFLDDIHTRESQSITSMDGIAYPHAKSQHVSEPAIAIGVKKSGIDYGDEDGIQPTVFFMIASPDNGADHHIYVLQELFGKFSDEFITELHQAQTPQQALTTLLQD